MVRQNTVSRKTKYTRFIEGRWCAAYFEYVLLGCSNLSVVLSNSAMLNWVENEKIPLYPCCRA